jgi:hypothetical protein
MQSIVYVAEASDRHREMRDIRFLIEQRLVDPLSAEA